MAWYDILFNIFLAFLGVVIALWYENLGAPSLRIIPHDTSNDIKQDGRRTRILHLKVINNPKKFPFVPRQTANAVHGTITFINEEGNVIANSMPIKWDGTPEPLNPEISNNRIVYLPDLRLLRVTRYIDIPPDENETLAIAILIHGDESAFGWTGGSYFYDWRHPDFLLPKDKYTAIIKIYAADTKKEEKFRFVVGDEFEEFDLLSNKNFT